MPSASIIATNADAGRPRRGTNVVVQFGREGAARGDTHVFV
jgi:hypothetical protein